MFARTSTLLAGETPLPKRRSHFVSQILGLVVVRVILDVVQRTGHWPAVAAAAIAWQAWLELNLYPRLPWLGLIMAAAVLRGRGLAAHLLPLAAGFKQSRCRPQGREGAADKLVGF